MSGGIAVHDQGVTFSPWTINDTFATAKMDNNITGIRITSRAGPVWTDFRGNAVVPSIQPWRTSGVEIDTASLPKNIDIGNGTKMIKQGRGAVGKAGFNAIAQRRTLLNTTLSDGKELPRGAAIGDNEDSYLTTSMDNGIIFLDNIEPDMVLDIKDEQQSYRIHLTFPEDTPKDMFYETTAGKYR